MWKNARIWAHKIFSWTQYILKKIKKWVENLNRLLFKEDILMANKHVKRCLISANQNYNEASSHTGQNGFHQKYLPAINAREGVEKKVNLSHCWWECKLILPLWRTEWRFFKKLKIALNMTSNLTTRHIPRENYNSKAISHVPFMAE